jgi:hypothetical protein
LIPKQEITKKIDILIYLYIIQHKTSIILAKVFILISRKRRWKMKVVYTLVILSLLALSVGCSSVPKRMGALQGKEYEVLGRGKAEGGGVMLLNVIPIGHNTKIERTYDLAVSQLGGDDLINPTITERWFWACVLNGYRVKIEGDVIKYKNDGLGTLVKDKEQKKVTPTNKTISGMTEELRKLNEMKEKGLINDSEYSKLKAKIIDKY